MLKMTDWWYDPQIIHGKVGIYSVALILKIYVYEILYANKEIYNEIH